ncbi:hypothetical protein [Massilia aquatica]|uniref:Uncharacterized protein n=1 Tax=Massilia aquatica TaxID=2609000 RepID=A0ABX0MFS4_9BURK|nr:hypothetical protein [Massilia aquatica]NHZ42751.1 hypothetical protein [Massilia aquatica]
MSIQDLSKEKNYFIELTANLDIFSNRKNNFFKEYHIYLNSALRLVESKFPPEAYEWIGVAAACVDGSATVDEVKDTQNDIYVYRKNILGLNEISIEPSSELDALTLLFLFCVEHADDEYGINCSIKSSVIQAIDEFSTIFIEAFENGENLVLQLHRAFGMPE